MADNADQCAEYLARVLTDVPYFAATLHEQEQRLLETLTGYQLKGALNFQRRVMGSGPIGLNGAAPAWEHKLA